MIKHSFVCRVLYVYMCVYLCLYMHTQINTFFEAGTVYSEHGAFSLKIMLLLSDQNCMVLE